jgi:hypothetical protein
MRATVVRVWAAWLGASLVTGVAWAQPAGAAVAAVGAVAAARRVDCKQREHPREPAGDGVFLRVVRARDRGERPPRAHRAAGQRGGLRAAPRCAVVCRTAVQLQRAAPACGLAYGDHPRRQREPLPLHGAFRPDLRRPQPVPRGPRDDVPAPVALGRLAHVPRRRRVPAQLVAPRQPQHGGRRRPVRARRQRAPGRRGGHQPPRRPVPAPGAPRDAPRRLRPPRRRTCSTGRVSSRRSRPRGIPTAATRGRGSRLPSMPSTTR